LAVFVFVNENRILRHTADDHLSVCARHSNCFLLFSVSLYCCSKHASDSTAFKTKLTLSRAADF